MSARHCTVTVDVSGILLRDESSNGTFVNDKRVGKGKEQRLKDGDSVALVMKDVSMTLMVKSSELHNEETGTIDGSDFEHLDRTLPASLEDDEDDKKEAAAERGAEAVEDFAAACSQVRKHALLHQFSIFLVMMDMKTLIVLHSAVISISPAQGSQGLTKVWLHSYCSF